MFGATPQEKAYLAPFFGFLLVFVLGGAVAHFCEGAAFWMASAPRYWMFPLQTVVSGALLAQGWRSIEWRAPRGLLLAFAVGATAFALWIALRRNGSAFHRGRKDSIRSSLALPAGPTR